MKNLLYHNADKWMEKLSTIPWGIPNDKWTEHKFEPENGVDKVARQSLTIQSQNIIDCLRFFMEYTSFQEN